MPSLPHAAGRDEDRVVGVVGDDLVQVAGAERLGVVGEHFLGRACHRAAPFR
jgi:hypothetical protein